MSAHRSRRIDRRTAEQLLRGQPAQADALSDLLSAAAAPTTAGEFAGEQAALAAFRAAHPTPVLQPRRGSMIKTTLAKLLTVKIAAAAVGAVAVGGVAVAAATGTLPTQSGGNATVPPTTSHASQANDVASTAQSERPAATGDDKKPDNGATPSPSLEGLCKAYTAGAGADHGKALDNPAFTVLITTAGGEDKVSAYCTDLLGEEPGQPDNTHPVPPPAAQQKTEPDPQGPPDSRPTGPPAARPSK